MNRESIYKLLNLNEQVPSEIVKKAFRNFAKRNHPDYFPGDQIKEDLFKRVNSAYQNWKLIQGTVSQIKRLRTDPRYSEQFRPWTFSCWA